jgi:hypothetical protein
LKENQGMLLSNLTKSINQKENRIMINIIKRNLYILFSFVFFLFVSAFSFMPDAESDGFLTANCYTCDGPNCAQAQFCGMTQCDTGDPFCSRWGTLCPPNCGEEC